jgi:hypothetical protein
MKIPINANEKPVMKVKEKNEENRNEENIQCVA